MSNEEITFESLATAYELDLDVLKAEFEDYVSKYKEVYRGKTGNDLPSEYERQLEIQFLRKKQSVIRKDETATGEELIGMVLGMNRVQDKSDFSTNLGLRFYQQNPSGSRVAYRRPPFWVEGDQGGKSTLIIPKFLEDGKTKNNVLRVYDVANGRAVIKDNKLVPTVLNGAHVPVKWVRVSKEGDNKGEPEVLETRQFFEEKDATGKITGYRFNDAFGKPIKARYSGSFLFIGRKVEGEETDLKVYWLNTRTGDAISDVDLPPMNVLVKMYAVLDQKPTDMWGYDHGRLGSRKFHDGGDNVPFLVETDKDVIADVIGTSTPRELITTHLIKRKSNFGIDAFGKAETRHKGVKQGDYVSKSSAKFQYSEVWVQEVAEGQNGGNHRLVLETKTVGGEDNVFTGWLTSSIPASELAQSCNALIIYEGRFGWNNFAGKKIWSANLLNFFADRSTLLVESPDVDFSFDDLERLMNAESGTMETLDPSELDVADSDDMMAGLNLEDEETSTEETKVETPEETKGKTVKAKKKATKKTTKKAPKKEKVKEATAEESSEEELDDDITLDEKGDAELPEADTEADTFKEWDDEEDE